MEYCSVCVMYYFFHVAYFIAGEALTSQKLHSTYNRKKVLQEKTSHVRESYVNLGPVQENPKLESIVVFDPRDVIRNILSNHRLESFDSHMKCFENGRPMFVEEIKRVYGDEVITGYLDSPALKEILNTVPEDEMPPVLISLYADGVDRDSMGHSSLLNRVHATYIQVLNLNTYGIRQRDDYRLIQLGYEDSLRKFGYNAFHKHLVANISNLIRDGMEINGRRHAVRLCFLQVNIT